MYIENPETSVLLIQISDILHESVPLHPLHPTCLWEYQ